MGDYGFYDPAVAVSLAGVQALADNTAYVLAADITSETPFTFSGSGVGIVVDGSGHTICISGTEWPGLFSAPVTVLNLTLTTDSSSSLAAEAGWFFATTVGGVAYRCTNNGPILNDNCNNGGIFGSYSAGTALHCTNTGAIGVSNGGIFAGNSSGKAIGCVNSGAVGQTAGGIFARTSGGTAINCSNTGPLGVQAGAIYGYSCTQGSAINCSNTGPTTEIDTAGIVSYSSSGTVTNCYSSTSSIAYGVGPGSNSGVVVNNCYSVVSDAAYYGLNDSTTSGGSDLWSDASANLFLTGVGTIWTTASDTPYALSPTYTAVLAMLYYKYTANPAINIVAAAVEMGLSSAAAAMIAKTINPVGAAISEAIAANPASPGPAVADAVAAAVTANAGAAVAAVLAAIAANPIYLDAAVAAAITTNPSTVGAIVTAVIAADSTRDSAVVGAVAKAIPSRAGDAVAAVDPSRALIMVGAAVTADVAATNSAVYAVVAQDPTLASSAVNAAMTANPNAAAGAVGGVVWANFNATGDAVTAAIGRDISCAELVIGAAVYQNPNSAGLAVAAAIAVDPTLAELAIRAAVAANIESTILAVDAVIATSRNLTGLELSTLAEMAVRVAATINMWAAYYAVDSVIARDISLAEMAVRTAAKVNVDAAGKAVSAVVSRNSNSAIMAVTAAINENPDAVRLAVGNAVAVNGNLTYSTVAAAIAIDISYAEMAISGAVYYSTVAGGPAVAAVIAADINLAALAVGAAALNNPNSAGYAVTAVIAEDPDLAELAFNAAVVANPAAAGPAAAAVIEANPSSYVSIITAAINAFPASAGQAVAAAVTANITYAGPAVTAAIAADPDNLDLAPAAVGSAVTTNVDAARSAVGAAVTAHVTFAGPAVTAAIAANPDSAGAAVGGAVTANLAAAGSAVGAAVTANFAAAGAAVTASIKANQESASAAVGGAVTANVSAAGPAVGAAVTENITLTGAAVAAAIAANLGSASAAVGGAVTANVAAAGAAVTAAVAANLELAPTAVGASVAANPASAQAATGAAFTAISTGSGAVPSSSAVSDIVSATFTATESSSPAVQAAVTQSVAGAILDFASNTSSGASSLTNTAIFAGLSNTPLAGTTISLSSASKSALVTGLSTAASAAIDTTLPFVFSIPDQEGNVTVSTSSNGKYAIDLTALKTFPIAGFPGYTFYVPGDSASVHFQAPDLADVVITEANLPITLNFTNASGSSFSMVLFDLDLGAGNMTENVAPPPPTGAQTKAMFDPNTSLMWVLSASVLSTYDGDNLTQVVAFSSLTPTSFALDLPNQILYLGTESGLYSGSYAGSLTEGSFAQVTQDGVAITNHITDMAISADTLYYTTSTQVTALPLAAGAATSVAITDAANGQETPLAVTYASDFVYVSTASGSVQKFSAALSFVERNSFPMTEPQVMMNKGSIMYAATGVKLWSDDYQFANQVPDSFGYYPPATIDISTVAVVFNVNADGSVQQNYMITSDNSIYLVDTVDPDVMNIILTQMYPVPPLLEFTATSSAADVLTNIQEYPPASVISRAEAAGVPTAAILLAFAQYAAANGTAIFSAYTGTVYDGTSALIPAADAAGLYAGLNITGDDAAKDIYISVPNAGVLTLSPSTDINTSLAIDDTADATYTFDGYPGYTLTISSSVQTFHTPTSSAVLSRGSIITLTNTSGTVTYPVLDLDLTLGANIPPTTTTTTAAPTTTIAPTTTVAPTTAATSQFNGTSAATLFMGPDSSLSDDIIAAKAASIPDAQIIVQALIRATTTDSTIIYSILSEYFVGTSASIPANVARNFYKIFPINGVSLTTVEKSYSIDVCIPAQDNTITINTTSSNNVLLPLDLSIDASYPVVFSPGETTYSITVADGIQTLMNGSSVVGTAGDMIAMMRLVDTIINPVTTTQPPTTTTTTMPPTTTTTTMPPTTTTTTTTQSPEPPAPICFFGDAPVKTPHGYRRMDSLKIGDRVSTPTGTAVIRHIHCQDYAAGPHSNPYVIPKGRYGATQDLLISPRHRVQANGQMVEARDLGLQQEARSGTLTYYNLGLPRWANMIVAGVTVESLAPLSRVTISRAEFDAILASRYGGRMTPEIRANCQFDGDRVSVPIRR
jgi:hypothetical protein